MADKNKAPETSDKAGSTGNAAPWMSNQANAGQPASPEASEPVTTPVAPDVIPETPKAPDVIPETPVVTVQTKNVIGEVKAEFEEVEMVIANVVKGFRLRMDHEKEHIFKVGVQKMPRAMAEHWFSKANGVTIVNLDKVD